ncbi:MAG: MBL fold metallo-hydrolase [Candidatus Hadarchaeales archaeon]
MEGDNRGRYPFSNSLLLKGRNLTALIDTGIGPEKARELAKEEKVDLLLVSHGHEDHFCQNRLFEGATQGVHRPANHGNERSNWGSSLNSSCGTIGS